VSKSQITYTRGAEQRKTYSSSGIYVLWKSFTKNISSERWLHKHTPAAYNATTRNKYGQAQYAQSRRKGSAQTRRKGNYTEKTIMEASWRT